jgi:glucokinase
VSTGRGSDDVIYITWSTGIGGGVITGGRLLTGVQGFAAELGHMTIDLNGPRCNCGSIGCLEMMASGTAIARIAVERLSRGEVSSISDLTGGDMGKVTSRLVAEAARSGDQLASDVMLTATDNLGVGLANYVHIFNPEIIVLGGGVSQSGDMLFPRLREVVAERMMPDYAVRIEPAALGDDCGLLGAAALVLGDYL